MVLAIMKNLLHVTVASFFFCLPTVLQAQQQEAHVHGIETLSLAFEDTTLAMEFESPAANLLGFEHQTKGAEEKQLVKEMAATLSAPDKLFTFAGTTCITTDVAVNTEDLIANEQEHEHEHKHHHDHGHGKGHDEEQGKEHREIKAEYRLSCENTANIQSVSTSLFQRYPGIEKLNLMWVSDSGQGAATLSAERNATTLH